MNRGDIVKAGIIVAAVAGFFYFINQTPDEEVTDLDSVVDTLEETERQIEEQFQTEVPEDAERAELTGSIQGRALATRESTEQGTDISVLADLPDPEQGSFYQAWAQNGDEDEEDFERISLGRLRVAKGGFVTEYTSENDLSEFNTVFISEETSQDSEPEETVLQGNFD